MVKHNSVTCTMTCTIYFLPSFSVYHCIICLHSCQAHALSSMYPCCSRVFPLHKYIFLFYCLVFFIFFFHLCMKKLVKKIIIMQAL